MDAIEQKLLEVKDRDNKLVLIVGKPGTGKSKLISKYSYNYGIPVLDFNHILGESIPEGKDNDYIYKFVEGFLKTYKQKVVLIDKKKILYDVNSNIDMLEFLKKLSKEHFVVATWNGYIENNNLIHIRNNKDLIYPLDSLSCSIIEL